jgi:hypothetical protein
MIASPFTFYRGSAIIQAHDLAGTPNSSLTMQICGDCHLMNFGGFATPERALLFDVNDFDETSPGPWEWDLKRLAASFVVAARHLRHGATAADNMVYQVVNSYRDRMAEYAEMAIRYLVRPHLRAPARTAIPMSRSASGARWRGPRRERTNRCCQSSPNTMGTAGAFSMRRLRCSMSMARKRCSRPTMTGSVSTIRPSDRPILQRLQVDACGRPAPAARPFQAAGHGFQSGRRWQRRHALPDPVDDRWPRQAVVPAGQGSYQVGGRGTSSRRRCRTKGAASWTGSG